MKLKLVCTKLTSILTEKEWIKIQGSPQKNGYPVLGDNFGNSAPILTILSLYKAEIHGA